MEKRGIEYMEAVREAFLQQLPESGRSSAIINANQAPDQVANDIVAAVDRFLAT